jgi:thiamine transporter
MNTQPNETSARQSRSGLDPKVLRLVESAVMLGLATALSMVKLFQMPLGGSVTLCSMLPILLIAYKYGPKWGVGTGLTYGLIQLLLDLGKALAWGLTPTALATSFVFDYLVAFAMLGLAGVYGKGLKQYVAGMSTAVALRFVCHVIAGVTAYASWLPKEWQGHLFLYSLAYNGTFLLPDFAICLAVGLMIYKPMKKFLAA